MLATIKRKDKRVVKNFKNFNKMCIITCFIDKNVHKKSKKLNDML